jgi:hypothetical protein
LFRSLCGGPDEANGNISEANRFSDRGLIPAEYEIGKSGHFTETLHLLRHEATVLNTSLDSLSVSRFFFVPLIVVQGRSESVVYCVDVSVLNSRIVYTDLVIFGNSEHV